MFKVRIEGRAKANVSVKNIEVNNIHGDDSDFVEYMRDGGLKSKIVGEAYMQFEKKGGSLFSVVEYEVSEKLSDKEMQELADYTQGQWADGIGECFEQNPCGNVDGKDLYISPWTSSQVVSVSQSEI